ncbi:SDR family NAD(P)-dependent oxidoreductase [Streptomyces sp. NA04227]|uniref:type I polyketide synthase n=1 Tax=Streptomyces sp. NA04227 TaxID=2742136 RepID=UPI001591FF51|nr:type I polyketide synthase [Streptomyces sp. NA04227]QKW05279.1 SDR family NAD(P)-dependent oxidoreductase [Streptomyces sp. NA04227]
MPPRNPETLVQHYRSIFLERPEESLYRFLGDKDGTQQSLSNAELDLRARSIAVRLRERVSEGDRALILCPPGIEYLTSFLACLYAGVVAVPVYPPDPLLIKRTLPRLVGVVQDAEPAVILATGDIAAVSDQFVEHSADFRAIPWLTVDASEAVDPEAWRHPDADRGTIAFLQYTSGSTGRPKGVMVSHGNLLHNLRAINDRLYGHEPDNHMVTWLPPYHDMGLIGGLLAPAFGGFPTTFMAPVTFLKQPVRWLRAISEHGGTITGAPDFAYRLCVERVSEEERATLDLSALRVAFSGAEPVRPTTLDAFTRMFAPQGFARSAFLPCYGLAEGTLCVSGGDRAADPILREVDTAALAAGEAAAPAAGTDARTYVACGWTVEDQDIAIVDPETRARLPEGRVGEVWVSGPSVAEGYWQRPEESAEIFAARTTGTTGTTATGEGPFLRTGDLGFLDENGELYLTGRRKDVIIVEGRNHYPHDIELTVESCDPVLRPGQGVACSEESASVDGAERGERLVVLYEVTGIPSEEVAARVFTEVRARVSVEHGLAVHEIALLRRGSILKTSSGKLQRAGSLAAFREGRLKCLAHWEASQAATAAKPRPEDAPQVSAERAASAPAPATSADPAERRRVEECLVRELAERLGVDGATLDTRVPLASYGLRSVDMVGITGSLERLLGRSLPSTLVWEHPTVEALADHLAGGTAPPRPASGTDTTHTARTGADEPIAIVGIGCRFPGGANSPEAYWQLLREGRDAITKVPEDRWKSEDYFDEDPSAPGRTNTPWGGFVDGVDTFDPAFFGISGHEAARMDPQQRLMAEVAWEALEDAGIPAEELAGSPTGVFVGIATTDYLRTQFADLDRIDAYTGTGNAFSIAANRLSYLFDLRGPSMAVDTACSSSLVAVQQACRSLASGDCTVAVAGGVNVILSPALAINFSKAGAMAPDGRCKPFDSRADGYVRSEGAGAVVLKPLSRALADQDTIYGVIRGGAVNQDGRSNGIMAPNPQAQEEVLRLACADAGLRPAEVQYVEAHGTGTLLGDPIEAKALATVLGEGREPERPVLIGSVKSNLGHLEAAAGIAGLIKTALMLRHRSVPGTLHFLQPNPRIPFDEVALRVADKFQPWPVAEGPAVAGVSSFGFGGTNAHLILEEAPAAPAAASPAPVRPELLTVSARDEAALRELALGYADLLDAAGRAEDDGALAALCAAAALRRSHHEYRLACVASTRVEMSEALRAYAAGSEHPALASGNGRLDRSTRTAFVFSGQGPRWWPIAAELLDSEPEFRRVIEECDALLARWTDWSLLTQLTATGDDCLLADTAVGQPALCAVQIALAAVWRARGVEPSAVVGHSVGEIAAAQVAGALGLEDALRIALHRGRIIRQAVGKGRMAVTGLPLAEAERALNELGGKDIWVAAANSPTTTVLSGDPAALNELAESFSEKGIFCRLLESVDFASHCPYMDPLGAQLTAALTDLTARATSIPFLSTVTGEFAEGTVLDAAYWGENLRRPVLFDRAVAALAGDGHRVFVEIAPQAMLGDAVAERLAAEDTPATVVASLRREESGRAVLLGELGKLHCAGFPVDFGRLYGPLVPMVPLPGYAWQRERHWNVVPGKQVSGTPGGHPVLHSHVQSVTAPGTHHFAARLDLTGLPYLGDHRVGGAVVLPASLVLDAATAAAREALGGRRAVALDDVRFTGMTVVHDSAERPTFQLVLSLDGDRGTFRLYSRAGAGTADDDWTEAAQGTFTASEDGAAPAAAEADELAAVRGRCGTTASADDHYAGLDAAGLQYGPAFQGVRDLWTGEREAIARLAAPQDTDAYGVHPALLDSCLQVLAAALASTGEGAESIHLPVGVGRFALRAERAVPRWAHADVRAAEPDEDGLRGARVTLYDAQGEAVGFVDGIALRRLEGGAERDAVAESLLHVQWQELEAPDRPQAGQDKGWWLLLADRSGVGEELASALPGECVLVHAGDRDRDGRTLDPARPEQFGALLAQLRGQYGDMCAGVVHAWNLDLGEDALPGDGEQAAAGLDSAQDLGTVSVLHLVQALSAQDWKASPRLVLVTRGAQRLASDSGTPAFAQSALWGLARVVTLEHEELDPLVVDLDPARPEGETAALAAELSTRTGEHQLALRGAARYVPRLAPWTAPEPEENDWERRPYASGEFENQRLLAERPGILGSLTATPWQRTAPGPGQVEIEIRAAGLNFADVLKAMDICPGVPSGRTPLGAECAGRVVAVGEDVEDLRPGDEVIAVGGSSMAAYTTVARELVVPKPAGLSDEEAAGVPIAFLTAVYGLEYLAHLGEGETVLVHSATGGVGLAALQVARRRGATVLATAGTEEKRALLRSLGVEHVFDSRSLEFAERIVELTDGRGVDVVLNSLTGEALQRSLGLLAVGGRFVEIGKQDIYRNSNLGLLSLKHNRSFHAVDLERSITEQHSLMELLFSHVAEGFTRGDFGALPVRTFPYAQATAAFSYMAQARHTGKVVLRPTGEEQVALPPPSGAVRGDASYLITGGLGALGLDTARHLVDQGARHLVLLGRSAPSAEAERAIGELRARQAEIRVLSADVSRAADIASVLGVVDAELPPLAGVVHAAGVLDDGVLLGLDRDRFRRVAGAKVHGAWHLHRATADRGLDFFVLYSSAAAQLGSAGQGNYAAANAFLDGLAHYRRSLGLSALSVNWGPWSEAGLAARPDRAGGLEGLGILGIRSADGIAALDRLLPTATAQATVLPLDRARLARAAGSGLVPAMLTRLVDTSTAGGAQGATSKVRQELLAVEPGKRRKAVLVRHCTEQVASVLSLDVSRIDTAVPLNSLGFDSLMSLELRKRLEALLQIELPATVVWRFPTIDALVPFLAECMEIPLEAGPPESGPLAEAVDGPDADPTRTGGSLPATASESASASELDQLPDAEIEALLLAKLTEIEEGHDA